MRPRFIEHDWLRFSRTNENEAWESGYGPAPFTDDLLMSADEERPSLRVFAVARDIYTRAHLYPCWVWAFYDALRASASDTAIVDGVRGVWNRAEPWRLAAALVVVYQEKVKLRERLGAYSAIEARRLMLEAVRELGDPQGSNEARVD